MAGAFLGLVAVAFWRVLPAPGTEVETARLAGPLATALTMYSFDESAGTVLLDTGKSKAHGSITHGVWGDGRVGRGLDFAPGHRSGQH
ncbi:MAG: hypothetical protein Q7V01_11755, partial [Vicinamibacterales bacterium]|nr:hypothetical protein [Vicinamibacterales bacterium]